MVAGMRYGVDLRGAQANDAADIARLLGQAGAPADARQVAARLDAVAQRADGTVLVATGYDGAVIGVVALGWVAGLLHDHPVARVSVLAVDVEEGRRGIGRMLLKAASQAARTAGCDVLEAPAVPGGDAATGFYEATGFIHTGATWQRNLRRRG